MSSAALRGREGRRGCVSLKRLIIRPGAIGDCILSLPAIEFLQAEYTEVWVPTAVQPLVQCASRTRAIVSTGIDSYPPDVRALDGFDSIVSWYGANRPEFRAECAGLPIEFLQALPADSSMHATDFFLRQVGAPLGAIPRIAVDTPCDGFIAVHPFSGGAGKNWPLASFRQLAGLTPHPLRFTAGPEEALDDAVRFDNLLDLARWLASASAYVGNDSGVTHLAAAAGRPVAALFGPTDPGVWAPRGPAVRIASLSATPHEVADILSGLCADS